MHEGVLCYPIVDGKMLLLKKTRGHGAGKLVGPSGKIEPGESPRTAAHRETREEVGVEVTGLEKVGELEFVFGGEPYMHCHVFGRRKQSILATIHVLPAIKVNKNYFC